MSNELLFLIHTVVVSGSVLLALSHSYGALLTVLGTQLVLANVFVTKLIILFGMHTTCSEVFIVSGMYGVSLVQAYYGSRRARQTILYTFLLLLLFVIFSQLHMLYTPLQNGQLSNAFDVLLSPSVRMMLASMLSYILSERVHVWFTRFFKVHDVSSFWRVAAIGVGQLVDTVTFAYVGLYGLFPGLGSIILMSLIVKSIVIVMLAPLLHLAQWIMPLGSKEGV